MSASDHLHDQAIKAFNQYMKVWEFEDFWTRSNTFTAALQFVTAARTRWPNDDKIRASISQIERVILKNKDYFDQFLTKDGVWADDYGWCGIASLAARDYIRRFPDSSQIVVCSGPYLTIAQKCWDNMKEIGWDAVDTAKPVPHGCRNRARNGNPGTKNTVTNAVFFILCVRLYVAVQAVGGLDATPYRTMAMQACRWFEKWFNSKYDYLQQPPNGPSDARLIQERPIASPDYERKTDPTWEAGWVWMGDQGLMLAGLAEYVTSIPDPSLVILESNPRSVIRMVAAGLKALMFDQDSVLHEAPFQSAFSDDPKDYVCGRGVLLRELVSTEVQPFLAQDFTKNIAATASAAWATCDANSQFGAAWNSQRDEAFAAAFKKSWGYGDGALDWNFDSTDPVVQGVLQGAGLDALGAAIQVA
jgi:hypothetical protein